jgi:hypothetical protein
MVAFRNFANATKQRILPTQYSCVFCIILITQNFVSLCTYSNIWLVFVIKAVSVLCQIRTSYRKAALPRRWLRCAYCHLQWAIMFVTVGNTAITLGLRVCPLLCHLCLHSIRIFVVNKVAFSRNVSVIWVKRLSGRSVWCKVISTL